MLAVFLAISTGLAQGLPAVASSAIEAAEPGPLSQFGSRGIRVHDPSTIVRCEDEYWLFATGTGIDSWRSKDLTHWTSGPRVFARTPGWTTNAVPGNRGYFWAPDVIFLTNQYHLYYSVSTFGKNTSAIGRATNPTLNPASSNFAWTDRGMVIQSNSREDFNAIDPAVSLDADGRLWLVFGSFWSGIKLVELNAATGNRISPGAPVYSLARSESIEAAYIHRHANRYFLFVNWGRCCRGINSTYNIRVGRSERITGPYVDKDGVDLLAGGGSLLMDSVGPFIGPGHAAVLSEAGVDWLSCHFYDGTRRGTPTLAMMPMRWSPEGWPETPAFDKLPATKHD